MTHTLTRRPLYLRGDNYGSVKKISEKETFSKVMGKESNRVYDLSESVSERVTEGIQHQSRPSLYNGKKRRLFMAIKEAYYDYDVE